MERTAAEKFRDIIRSQGVSKLHLDIANEMDAACGYTDWDDALLDDTWWDNLEELLVTGYHDTQL